MRVIIAQAQGAGQDAPADMIAATVAWFVALVSVVLIFVPASNRYFRQMAAPTAG
jgi:Na+-driven multidrug efflux pump